MEPITHKEFLQAVGIEMKVARIRKRMSVAQIANVTGLSVACLRDMESGTTNSALLSYKRYADAVGVDLKAFM